MLEISKSEAFIVIFLSSFAAIWIGIIIPYLTTSQWFLDLIPPAQFIIFNLGLISMFTVIFAFPLTYMAGNRSGDGFSLRNLVKIGLSFWSIESFVIDMSFSPPYFLNSAGQVLLNSPEALTGTSVDGMITWCWQQLGISGSSLYYMVYWVTPVIALITLAVVLIPKQFVGLFISAKEKVRRK